ncbi:MAG TPA: citramalate synthase [Methylococcaceae bacterium]|nr:citramalate synthase [Methylococcaceae bacterium]
MNQIALYDTTLRDGAQREDISLSCDDKLAIALRLDQMGIHYIEAGWPGSNPKDAEFFQRAKQLPLRQARITAFGSTRRKLGQCESDKNLLALIAARTPAVTLVGKSWDFQVEKVLETTVEENLAMIRDSIAFMKNHAGEVMFDGEHFFDGFKANPDYALATLKAAQDAGADFAVLCDTNGGCLPWEVEAIVREVHGRIACRLGVHVHNDSGCAVANSLAAVRGGCTQIQGTINGYGERVGNADLTSIIPALQLKMGYAVVDPAHLRELTAMSRYVAEIANLAHNRHQPYVGESAFAHKGGIHAAAMLKTADSYQHMDPAIVGNVSRMVVSELSGRGNVLALAQQRGLEISDEKAQRVLDQLKKLEHLGYAFEAADASMDLLIHRARSDYKPPFELIDFFVLSEHRRGRGLLSEATVKVRVGDAVRFTAAEGNGPVNALAQALHQVLCEHYPELAEVQLTDYKVRILNSDKGTASVTRVLMDFHDGERAWTTVGASPNIIEASWQALADSMEYALTPVASRT